MAAALYELSGEMHCRKVTHMKITQGEVGRECIWKKRRPTSLARVFFFIPPSASTGGRTAYIAEAPGSLPRSVSGKKAHTPCLPGCCGANSQICLARAVFHRPRRTPQMMEQQKRVNGGRAGRPQGGSFAVTPTHLDAKLQPVLAQHIPSYTRVCPALLYTRTLCTS